MIITKSALPRRTFLRGMGASLALPFLDAMVPAAAAQSRRTAEPPPRLGFVYIPMGMSPAAWTPPATGAIDSLSPSLAALEPFIDRVTVISNLELRNAYTTGNHATANCCFLSCARPKRTEGSDYYLGVTVDQVAAARIGGDTPLPSLELSTDRIAQVGNCDNGYACVYQNSLSWSSATTPLPAEADPRIVFERLFGDGGTPQERQAEMRRDRSILDWMLEDIAALDGTLAPEDRRRMEQYLDSIREVERRIQRAEQQIGGSPLPELTPPSGVPADWEDHVKLMFDLQALAWQSDLTRVITFQMAREASTRTYPEIGVPEPHHPISHHTNEPDKLAKLAKINAYHVSLFRYFLDRLRSIGEGDGTLLDHAVLLLGSGMGNPDIHDHSNLPIVVAGGGGGLRGARHIRYAEQRPLANLHLTLLDRVGVGLDSFVDSTGRVDELLEPLSV